MVAAVLIIGILVLLHFILFEPGEDAFRLLLPSILASLIVVLAVYILRRTLFQSTGQYLDQEQISNLSSQIAGQLILRLPGSPDIICYQKWYEIPWREVLSDALTVEFCVGYMRTWIHQTADALLDIFNRGGTVRAFLPKPGSAAAERVFERFPGYSAQIVASNIENTPRILEGIRAKSTNANAKLEVYWTETYCMCMIMRVDRNRLIVSPFDTFRRERKEAPTFVIREDAYPSIAEWGRKELEGFRKTSVLAVVESDSPAASAARVQPAR